jgi:acyl-CoA thioester hydrolase
MFSVEIEVQFRDVDLFGHVNSAVVASYMETARYRYLKERVGRFEPCFVIARTEIDFLKPIFLGDVVRVSLQVSRVGTTSWDFSYTLSRHAGGVEGPGERAASARTVQVWYDFVRGEKASIPADAAAILNVDLGRVENPP